MKGCDIKYCKSYGVIRYYEIDIILERNVKLKKRTLIDNYRKVGVCRNCREKLSLNAERI